MDEMKKETEELVEQEIVEEKPPFEPSPRWKRICAWVLVVIVVIGVINWLISIAYPQWPEYIKGLLK